MCARRSTARSLSFPRHSTDLRRDSLRADSVAKLCYPSTAFVALRSPRRVRPDAGGRGPLGGHLERAAFAQEGRAVPAPPDASAPNSTPNSGEDPNVISFVSVGPPVPRHEVRIVNGRGEDAGERVEGQLWFRGPSTTRGYYRNEAATAALLPEGAAAGWVNSGDRAYRAGGEIYITGRVKDIIIHAGHNLYPHEIEDAVARVPGVRKGCVVAFGAPDPVAGTERLVIVAESRAGNGDARARLAQAITAQVTETLGLPPNVVGVVSPN